MSKCVWAGAGATILLETGAVVSVARGGVGGGWTAGRGFLAHPVTMAARATRGKSFARKPFILKDNLI